VVRPWPPPFRIELGLLFRRFWPSVTQQKGGATPTLPSGPRAPHRCLRGELRRCARRKRKDSPREIPVAQELTRFLGKSAGVAAGEALLAGPSTHETTDFPPLEKKTWEPCAKPPFIPRFPAKTAAPGLVKRGLPFSSRPQAPGEGVARVPRIKRRGPRVAPFGTEVRNRHNQPQKNLVFPPCLPSKFCQNLGHRWKRLRPVPAPGIFPFPFPFPLSPPYRFCFSRFPLFFLVPRLVLHCPYSPLTGPAVYPPRCSRFLGRMGKARPTPKTLCAGAPLSARCFFGKTPLPRQRPNSGPWPFGLPFFVPEKKNGNRKLEKKDKLIKNPPPTPRLWHEKQPAKKWATKEGRFARFPPFGKLSKNKRAGTAPSSHLPFGPASSVFFFVPFCARPRGMTFRGSRIFSFFSQQ